MFRIGEFSKIARVSGRLLRHYDDLGLLKPIEVDASTGYRYYNLSQLPRLNRILALKDLGLSLDQIKRFIDDDISADALRGMFKMKKAQIEQTLREELDRLSRIEVRLEQIEREGTISDYEVIIKPVPARRFLSVTAHITSINKGFEIINDMNHRLPARVKQKALGNFFTILRSEVFEEGDLEMEMGFLLTGDFDGTIPLSNNQEMTVTELPAVEQMATTVRTGIQNTALACYASLGNWIELNDYEIAGPVSEIFLTMPPPNRANEAVIEAQIPITK